MKIRFLGTSHGYNEAGRFCSSAVVSCGGKHYVIDAGAPIMGLLPTYGYSYSDIGGIFITHTHQDHYGGLVEFTNQIEGFGRFSDIRVSVYVPPEFPVERLMIYLFGNPYGRDKPIPGASAGPGPCVKRVEYIHYQQEEGVIFSDDNVKITAFPTMHCSHSHAFLVEGDGKRVMFSGDLKSGFTDYPALLTDDKSDYCDVLVIEGAHTRLNSPEAVELFRRSRIRRAVVNHLYRRLNSETVIDEMRQEVADLFPVDEAYDGMEFEV